MNSELTKFWQKCISDTSRFFSTPISLFSNICFFLLLSGWFRSTTLDGVVEQRSTVHRPPPLIPVLIVGPIALGLGSSFPTAIVDSPTKRVSESTSPTSPKDAYSIPNLDEKWFAPWRCRLGVPLHSTNGNIRMWMMFTQVVLPDSIISKSGKATNSRLKSIAPKEVKVLMYLLNFTDPEERFSALSTAFSPGKDDEAKDPNNCIPREVKIVFSDCGPTFGFQKTSQTPPNVKINVSIYNWDMILNSSSKSPQENLWKQNIPVGAEGSTNTSPKQRNHPICA
ncbi:unnamed protein product [Lactuca virosa]|uniref:Uncharacterized protein n=1 Tax=Lactuca virosa TaxID=75947 RepID=A0AAU9PCB3_9ASTR|nr:unnamed protein product [Lactuca virosa]